MEEFKIEVSLRNAAKAKEAIENITDRGSFVATSTNIFTFSNKKQWKWAQTALYSKGISFFTGRPYEWP
jgi:hypothetical protein